MFIYTTALTMLRAENKSDHEADAGNDISFPYLSEN